MFKKLEAGLIGLVRRVGDFVKSLYFRVRLRKVLRYLDNEGEFIGESCPHEIRIPMEVVRSLKPYERKMLELALLLSVRPYGATLKVCRRCYCLTRATHKQTDIGPPQTWRDEVFVAPPRATSFSSEKDGEK